MTAPRGDEPARSSGASGGARGAIVIGLAVILGIIGLQILDDSGGGSSDATVTTPTTGQGTGATATTVGVRPNNEVRVKVYNASGVQGRAQILSDTLRTKNYNVQTPANLGNERQGTVVECVKGFEIEARLLAFSGVGNGATTQEYPSDPPEGAAEADCIVIIGTA